MGVGAGQWTPIKGNVGEIAEFAVKEGSGGKMVLEKVVEGETQVVAGINYKLVLDVKDGTSTKRFEALVYERPWENVMILTSFKQLQANV